MSQIILHILCEGQTEERFVDKVLKIYLKDSYIVSKAHVLFTNKKKNTEGGIIHYEQVKKNLRYWILQQGKSISETHYYTTMFDLYALPDDFPGYEEAKMLQDCYMRVHRLEERFAEDINLDKFIPYIQLHEFEALVFCGLDYLLINYPNMTKQVDNLKKIVKEYSNNTERIDDSPHTAPSRRIQKEFGTNYRYNKPESGELVTAKVGITGLKEKCPHFKEWIEKLEGLSQNK